MRYRKEIDNVRAHIRSLRAVIGLQALAIALLWWGWHQAPRAIRVFHPPDLPPATVYAFAHYLFQQLNRWPQDGEQDYGRQIYRLAAYLTPRYRAELLADLDLRGRRGELSYRQRGVQEVPGHGYAEQRVEVLGNDAWVVWLDLEIAETVRGMTVKTTVVRYPLRVVRHAVDPEANPWGLAISSDESMLDNRSSKCSPHSMICLLKMEYSARP